MCASKTRVSFFCQIRLKDAAKWSVVCSCSISLRMRVKKFVQKLSACVLDHNEAKMPPNFSLLILHFILFDRERLPFIIL